MSELTRYGSDHLPLEGGFWVIYDEANAEIEKLRASLELAENKSSIRKEEAEQMRFGMHRAEAERDEARAETARLKAQLDPESVKHWDSMRAERDEARAALREMAQHMTVRVLDLKDGSPLQRWMVFENHEDAVLVSEETAAAIRAAKEEEKR